MDAGFFRFPSFTEREIWTRSSGEGEAFFEFGLIPDGVEAFDDGSGGVGPGQAKRARRSSSSV